MNHALLQKNTKQPKQPVLSHWHHPDQSDHSSVDGSLPCSPASPHPVQMKMNTDTGSSPDDAGGRDSHSPLRSSVVANTANHTGLPGPLKLGVEQLSGFAMDDVKVHYNSDKPAQLKAHAYAQGDSIYVAPGQEQHLPHEAWHVVQQKQNRVPSGPLLKADTPINHDSTLEREADVMGEKAVRYSTTNTQKTRPRSTLTKRSLNTTYSTYQLKVINDSRDVKTDKKSGAGLFSALRFPKASHASIKRLQDLMNLLDQTPDIDMTVAWQRDLAISIWNHYGRSKGDNITLSEVADMITSKEKNAAAAIEVMKHGVSFGQPGEQKKERMANQQRYLDNKDNYSFGILNALVTDMSTRLQGMLDQLTYAFYFKQSGEKEILDDSDRVLSNKRIKAKKGLGFADEYGNTGLGDMLLGNYDYVFGLLEHKNNPPSIGTRYARNGRGYQGGMRIVRPLRPLLNQPGTLMQVDDLMTPNTRDTRKGVNSPHFPGQVIGAQETSTSIDLKQYTPPPGSDKAAMMIRDLVEFVRTKLWLQCYANLETIHGTSDANAIAQRQGTFQQRMQLIQQDYQDIKELSDANYLNAWQRKYVKIQLLIPGELRHAEPGMRVDWHRNVWDNTDAVTPTPNNEAFGTDGYEAPPRKISNSVTEQDYAKFW